MRMNTLHDTDTTIRLAIFNLSPFFRNFIAVEFSQYSVNNSSNYQGICFRYWNLIEVNNQLHASSQIRWTLLANAWVSENGVFFRGLESHVRRNTKTKVDAEKMPSLSNPKTEPIAPTDATEFAKNMVTMMEKKIRNLEKRKVILVDKIRTSRLTLLYYILLLIIIINNNIISRCRARYF